MCGGSGRPVRNMATSCRAGAQGASEGGAWGERRAAARQRRGAGRLRAVEGAWGVGADLGEVVAVVVEQAAERARGAMRGAASGPESAGARARSRGETHSYVAMLKRGAISARKSWKTSAEHRAGGVTRRAEAHPAGKGTLYGSDLSGCASLRAERPPPASRTAS
jgi:hypothetical protein